MKQSSLVVRIDILNATLSKIPPIPKSAAKSDQAVAYFNARDRLAKNLVQLNILDARFRDGNEGQEDLDDSAVLVAATEQDLGIVRSTSRAKLLADLF